MLKSIQKRMYAFMGCAALCVAMTAQPLAVQISAEAAVLIDADSGRVLYEKNANQEMLIASTTKIMTALVAIESCSLDELVTITKDHMVEGSSMYLKPGETWRLETLLYGLMLASGNDAALAIADHCGPGQEQFVAKMNQKAAALNLAHTSFANPNGLDADGHYSSAEDMAKLAAHAIKNDAFVRIVSTKHITIDGRTFTNHNKLLAQYPGCIGLKTGYTKAAGRTLVSCAAREDMKLIAVTLKDGNDWSDHAALYDYGFAEYHKEILGRKGECAKVLPVLNGTQKNLSLCYSEDVAYPVHTGETVEMVWEGPDAVCAPIKRGTYAGEIVFLANGTEISRVPMYYSADVEALARYQKDGMMDLLFAALLS